jgi:hypothetical protein
MIAKASLKAIVDELEVLMDQRHAYLNKVTGEVVSISDEDIDLSEIGDPLDDYPDWQQELIHIACEVLHSQHYIELPSKYDIHDYSIIESFCLSQEDHKLRDTLVDLIRGSGAFGRFKEAIHQYSITEAWYHFRRAAYRQIAVDWLQVNEISFIDDDK